VDFETAVEAYVELEMEGPYKEEALELLAEEICHSSIVSPEDKDLLERILQKIRQAKLYGRTGAIKEIWDILTKYEGFKNRFAEVSADILFGKRKR
jgi:hypothetical protein